VFDIYVEEYGHYQMLWVMRQFDHYQTSHVHVAHTILVDVHR
jgi:hypothetical protein